MVAIATIWMSHFEDSNVASKDPINGTLNGLATAAAKVSRAQARGSVDQSVIKVLALRVAQVGIWIWGLGRQSSVMKFCGECNGGIRV